MLPQQQVGAIGNCFPGIASDTALIREMTLHATAARLQRGHGICREGDNCSHLALVTDGAARVFKLAESGREITLYRVEPGECCILTASCMLSRRPFPANADVEADLQAILIPEPWVLAWMTSSASWRQFLWSLLAERLAGVISLVEEVAFRRMDQRLGEYLAARGEERGKVLRATHSQVAADLGTSREVVSRLLKDFEQRRWLQLGRGRIELLDPAALRSQPPV